jgi:prepilin-type processing-associated H-X9-DG protein
MNSEAFGGSNGALNTLLADGNVRREKV